MMFRSYLPNAAATTAICVSLSACSELEHEFPYEATKRNCALFAMHYNVHGSSNAGDNVGLAIVENTNFTSARSYYEKIEKMGWWSELGLEMKIEAFVTNKRFDAIDAFASKCVQAFRRGVS